MESLRRDLSGFFNVFGFTTLRVLDSQALAFVLLTVFGFSTNYTHR